MEKLIVLDLGTTGVKAALLDRSGRVLAEDYRAYPTNVHDDRVEQDPADWWEGAVSVMASAAGLCERGSVAGICLSGQMQDLITLDANGSSGPAILYSDARAYGEAATVAGIIGAGELASRTGNLQDGASLLAKILWLRQNEPSRYRSSRRLLFGAHDYVAWRLTGTEATDYTTLSTTGLLDITANAYAWSIIDALGFERSLFPTLVRADHQDGGLLAEPARLIGVPAGTPVFHGSGDAGSTTLGAGAGVPGVLSCYLGTSGWLAATSSGGCVNPRTGIFNLRHPDSSSLIHIGPMLLAAGNVDWAIETIGLPANTEGRYESFTSEASRAKPGCGGLVYLPYLVGERSPFRDSRARGVFAGLSRSTGSSSMFRAVLEGVAFAMRSIHEAMDPGDLGTARRLSLSGGGARSPLWPQIFADVFDSEVSVAEHAPRSGLIGAFVIAGKALGWQDGYLPPRQSGHEDVAFRPIVENRHACERAYAAFRGLYPALRESFAALADVDTEDRSQTDPGTKKPTRRDP